MDVMNEPVICACVLALQIVGLASMAMVRLPFNAAARRCCQVLFFTCLVVVGCATMVAVGSGSSAWLWSGTTLSVMSVGSILDLGRAGELSVV